MEPAALALGPFVRYVDERTVSIWVEAWAGEVVLRAAGVPGQVAPGERPSAEPSRHAQARQAAPAGVRLVPQGRDARRGGHARIVADLASYWV